MHAAISLFDGGRGHMENSDPRYVRSRLKLRAALLELADEDTSKLSVSAVCERTRIDRATFYRHFDDLDGLLEDTLRSLADEGADEWLAISEGSGLQVETSVGLMTAYFEQVIAHWELYRWALGPGGSARVIHSILTQQVRGVDAELTKLYGEDEDTHYRSWFMGGALVGTLLHWLQSERPERDPEDLARWILRTSMAAPSLAPQD